jgi:hypothetical protein
MAPPNGSMQSETDQWVRGIDLKHWSSRISHSDPIDPYLQGGPRVEHDK